MPIRKGRCLFETAQTLTQIKIASAKVLAGALMHPFVHDRKCRSHARAGLARNGKNLISIKESSFRAGFIGGLSSPLGKKS